MKTQYSHLEFYNNSMNLEASSSSGGNGTANYRGIALGGSSLVPGLELNAGIESKETTGTNLSHRSSLEKQIDIVEYLKKLPVDSKVSFPCFLLQEVIRVFPRLLSSTYPEVSKEKISKIIIEWIFTSFFLFFRAQY